MANPMANTVREATANDAIIIAGSGNTATINRAVVETRDPYACLKSLAFPHMESRSLDIATATQGTCEWLLRHDVYERWRACHRGLLWIKGKPGSGKSTLLRYALDNHQVGEGDLALSFFFHGRGDELQRTPLGFFRSLLHQVLTQAPDACPGLLELFERRLKGMGQPRQDWEWHPNELRSFLESSLQRILKDRSVWLFVDALDECGEANAVVLFRWMKSLLSKLPVTGSQSHICLACRHYPILDRDCEFDICPEDENWQDVSTYVQAEISPSRELAGSQLPDLITKRARGVFMWARLVVEQVLDFERDGEPMNNIEAKIKLFRPDLGGLYQSIIQSMGPESMKLIQWIAFATRPMSVDELRWAMIVNPDRTASSLREYESMKDYIPDTETMKRRVYKLSCGLAEVRTSVDTDFFLDPFDSDWFDVDSNQADAGSVQSTQSIADTELVQFIHQSVKDFFLDQGLLLLYRKLTLPTPIFAMTADTAVGMAHHQLSKTCLRCMTTGKTDLVVGDQARLLPFTSYATTSWVKHMKQSEARGISQEDILTFFPSPGHASDFLDLWNRALKEGGHSVGLALGSTLVHLLSRYGILSPLRVIMTYKTQPVGGVHATSGASQGLLEQVSDSEDYKDLLALYKSFVDSRNDDAESPLLLACRNGHESIASLLLDSDSVDVNSQDIFGRTSLIEAASNGHESIVKMLLSTGKVNVNLRTNANETALVWAAGRGHDAVVRLLLDTSTVDVNYPDYQGSSPLARAVERGHESVVRLLLDSDQVDVNSRDRFGMTPLAEAVERGDEAVASLLLGTSNVNVNSRYKYGRTPISLAVQSGSASLVEGLLQGGADVDTKDELGRTPLWMASMTGNETIVKILLDTGKVDVNLTTYQGITPLLIASRWGHEGIVRLLCSADGIDVDLADQLGRTPLTIAVRNKHKEAVKTLISVGKAKITSAKLKDEVESLLGVSLLCDAQGSLVEVLSDAH